MKNLFRSCISPCYSIYNKISVAFQITAMACHTVTHPPPEPWDLQGSSVSWGQLSFTLPPPHKYPQSKTGVRKYKVGGYAYRCSERAVSMKPIFPWEAHMYSHIQNRSEQQEHKGSPLRSISKDYMDYTRRVCRGFTPMANWRCQRKRYGEEKIWPQTNACRLR